MPGSRSSHKGSGYERKIAKILNESVFGYDAVYRQTNSGGLKRKTLYTGDIVPLNNSGLMSFPFHLELKKGYKWDVLDLITGKNQVLHKFWKQVIKDRARPEQQPYLALVLGKDRVGDFVVFENKLLTVVCTTQQIARYVLVEMPQIRFTYHIPHPTILVMVRLTDFCYLMSEVLKLPVYKKPRLRVFDNEKAKAASE
jgi:hypothetical protein